jgi:hypothetical protein
VDGGSDDRDPRGRDRVRSELSGRELAGQIAAGVLLGVRVIALKLALH